MKRKKLDYDHFDWNVQMKQSQFIDLKLQFTSMFKMSCHDIMKFLTIIKLLLLFSLGKYLVQSMIWQDRNLKFGPYYDQKMTNFSNLVTSRS